MSAGFAPAYAAVRAPIAEGGDYAWFANRGIGRPVAESLTDTMSWFHAWLDGVHGTLPFDAGVPTDPNRLAGLPVLVAQGDQDAVIPRELLDRTWDYLVGDSGLTRSGRTARRRSLVWSMGTR
jgi:phospholipase/carboxylesterase